MKSGFVAIVGRPSAGKSTLLNTLCGEKVAITSPYPQTTRSIIRGIVHNPRGQIIFVDTPGYHKSEKKINLYLQDLVHRSLRDADAVLYVVDASRPPGKEEQLLMEVLKNSRIPLVAALNKTDVRTPLLREIRGLIKTNINPRAMIDVSAVEKTNLPELIEIIFDLCPEGDVQYPDEFYTDQLPEFRISELIREQAIARCGQELPHALYVEVADMELHDHESREKTLWVRAFLTVERRSQVGILVGQHGSRIKKIRLAAMKEMRRIFDWKIELDLRVKVNLKWRKKDHIIRDFL